jgi:hypothetical protein
MVRGAGLPQRRPECWFCGAQGVSTEHILARSFTSLFGSVRSVTGMSFEPTTGQRRKVKQSKRFGMVTRIACEACNNGWMNDIDGAIRPVLGAMVDGVGLTLLPSGQRLLATWATKVAFAMVSTEAEPDQLVPRLRYRELAEGIEPPAGVQLWLGAHPRDHNVHFVGYRITIVALRGAPGYVLALSFGHACFVLMDHGQTDSVFDLTLLAAAQLKPLWPARSSREWPPTSRIRDPRLENLEGLLAREHNAFRQIVGRQEC